MPKYFRNTTTDVEFLAPDGVLEFLEDSLSDLPRDLLENDATKILFKCLRSKMGLDEIIESTKQVDWSQQPYEIQSIALGLKLFNR